MKPLRAEALLTSLQLPTKKKWPEENGGCVAANSWRTNKNGGALAFCPHAVVRLPRRGKRQTEIWDETLAAARKEGKLVAAVPPDTQVRQLLPAAFEARYGIRIEYISGRGSDF